MPEEEALEQFIASLHVATDVGEQFDDIPKRALADLKQYAPGLHKLFQKSARFRDKFQELKKRKRSQTGPERRKAATETIRERWGSGIEDALRLNNASRTHCDAVRSLALAEQTYSIANDIVVAIVVKKLARGVLQATTTDIEDAKFRVDSGDASQLLELSQDLRLQAYGLP